MNCHLDNSSLEMSSNSGSEDPDEQVGEGRGIGCLFSLRLTSGPLDKGHRNGVVKNPFSMLRRSRRARAEPWVPYFVQEQLLKQMSESDL